MLRLALKHHRLASYGRKRLSHYNGLVAFVFLKGPDSNQPQVPPASKNNALHIYVETRPQSIQNGINSQNITSPHALFGGGRRMFIWLLVFHENGDE